MFSIWKEKRVYEKSMVYMVVPTCNDGIMNEYDTDVDYGGNCLLIKKMWWWFQMQQ